MVIGLLTVRLSIPEARSLKDKRSIVRRIKDRITNKMNVSTAETGLQDVWKSAELAFVTVAAEKMIVERRLAEIGRALRSDPRYVLLDLHTEFL